LTHKGTIAELSQKITDRPVSCNNDFPTIQSSHLGLHDQFHVPQAVMCDTPALQSLVGRAKESLIR